MNGLARISLSVVTVVLFVPIATIYRQNIENWATSQGIDSLGVLGWPAMSEHPIGLLLIAACLLTAGASVALWSQYLLRKHFPPRMPKKKRPVVGQVFRHQEVVIDGKSFERCSFDGVTLVYKGSAYFDFKSCTFQRSFSVRIDTDVAEGFLGLIELQQSLGVPLKISGNRIQSPLTPEEETRR